MTQTPTPCREPRTEAGRRLLGMTVRVEDEFGRKLEVAPINAILRIESEAVRQALSELEEEVGGLAVYLPPKPFGPDDEYLDRAAVIELIHKKGADL